MSKQEITPEYDEFKKALVIPCNMATAAIVLSVLSSKVFDIKKSILLNAGIFHSAKELTELQADFDNRHKKKGNTIHAEKCPVCNGKGKVGNDNKRDCSGVPCHGCNGKGWIEVGGGLIIDISQKSHKHKDGTWTGSS